MPAGTVSSKIFAEKLIRPSLVEQVANVTYIPGKPLNPTCYQPIGDPGRIRYQPFFRKMYGNSPEEVEKNLVEIDWMPRIFGRGTYRLKVTKINNVHIKLMLISNELEQLVKHKPAFRSFVDKPAGTYRWRKISQTNRLSAHSFGMTIDLNTDTSHYWQWDLKKMGMPINEKAALTYHNTIPWDIVLIFEKYGFIWGGKWHHYDTMHFEYRPELLVPRKSYLGSNLPEIPSREAYFNDSFKRHTRSSA